METKKIIYFTEYENPKIYYKNPEIKNQKENIYKIEITENLFNEIKTCSYEKIKEIIFLLKEKNFWSILT